MTSPVLRKEAGLWKSLLECEASVLFHIGISGWGESGDGFWFPGRSTGLNGRVC